MSKGQKYQKGDHVQVAKDLGQCMGHFTNDCEAIIVGSYADQFSGEDATSYTIHIKGEGETSWYEEHQLTLIEANRIDLLEQWEKEEKEEAETKSSLDWIFAHGNEVLESAHGSTVKALAGCFGLANLWGSWGEGFTYYVNAQKTLFLAKPFLETGDKAGWLKHCASIKINQSD